MVVLATPILERRMTRMVLAPPIVMTITIDQMTKMMEMKRMDQLTHTMT